MSQRNPACNPIKKKGVRLDFSIEYKKSFNPIQNIFGRVKDGLDWLIWHSYQEMWWNHVSMHIH